MSTVSELIAKLELQFDRGLLTEEDFDAECLAVITAESNRRKRARSPFVVTEFSPWETTTHYYLTEEARDVARDVWLQDKMTLDSNTGYGAGVTVTIASRLGDPGDIHTWLQETREI